MAQILALYYSFTQQTAGVMQEVADALTRAGHTVTLERLELVEPYPFPAPFGMLQLLLKQALEGRWPVVALRPLKADVTHPYDLVIIGYQAWYLTPSVPVHSFLKGHEASILRGKPVIGLITCRAMYGRATNLFREWVELAGGRVVEQRVWVDQDSRPTNMVSLIHMLKEGHNPVSGPLRRALKPFGVGEAGFARARSYGEALAARLRIGPLSRDGRVVVMK